MNKESHRKITSVEIEYISGSKNCLDKQGIISCEVFDSSILLLNPFRAIAV